MQYKQMVAIHSLYRLVEGCFKSRKFSDTSSTVVHLKGKREDCAMGPPAIDARGEIREVARRVARRGARRVAPRGAPRIAQRGARRIAQRGAPRIARRVEPRGARGVAREP